MKKLTKYILLMAVMPVTIMAAPKLLPFQGHLTQSNGTAVADGAKVVQFKIYDAPVSGTAVWAGEVHKLSVNKGLVNTILGTKTAFPARYGAGNAKVMFSEPLYVEITVDADGNGSITAADPPLLPRQVLLPANFAHVAMSAETVEGHDIVDSSGKINPARIGDASIPGSALTGSSVTAEKITPDTITAAQIASNGVNTDELANNSVTTSIIKDGEVKTVDIGDSQVTGTKIAPSAINATHLPIGAVPPDRLELDCAMLTEEKASGPGAKSAGWTPRDLNKTQFVSGNSISLSGGQITLKKGTYWIEGSVPGYTGERHVGKFEKLSGQATSDLIGTGEYSANSAGAAALRSLIRGYVTVTSTTSTWRLNHYSSSASTNSNGLGVDTSGAPARVYAEVQIVRVK